MKFFVIIFFPIFINGHFLPAEKAKALLSRQKRANGFPEEYVRSSDANRECVNESCNFEEYIEAKENFVGSIDLRGMIDLKSINYKPEIETYFNRFYLNCEKDGITARQACFKKTDEKLDEVIFGTGEESEDEIVVENEVTTTSISTMETTESKTWTDEEEYSGSSDEIVIDNKMTTESITTNETAESTAWMNEENSGTTDEIVIDNEVTSELIPTIETTESAPWMNEEENTGTTASNFSQYTEILTDILTESIEITKDAPWMAEEKNPGTKSGGELPFNFSQ